MYKVKPTVRFQKDLKKAQTRGYDLALLTHVIKLLATGNTLPAKYKNHSLLGKYSNCMECHITPDWLLIYELVDDDLILYLTRTGTHADLF